MRKKRYTVTLPIAGHVVVEIEEAESEEDAIEQAMSKPVGVHEIESWETLRRFHQGNVCHCPSPWEAEAVEEE